MYLTTNDYNVKRKVRDLKLAQWKNLTQVPINNLTIAI